MATLLLRLIGPMQAWGTRSKLDDRDTEGAPSKSGVLGLCAAALGIDRAQPVGHLAALTFGVRVDRAGTVGRDYHTAQLYPGQPRTKTDVTVRAYLADAAFWAGLEGDGELLTELYAALKNPCWPLALGRKAFPPSLPVFAAPPQETSVWDALCSAPSLRRAREDAENLPYTLVLDRKAVPTTPPELRTHASQGRWQDVPAGPFATRRYALRDVLTVTWPLTVTHDTWLNRETRVPEVG